MPFWGGERELEQQGVSIAEENASPDNPAVQESKKMELKNILRCSGDADGGSNEDAEGEKDEKAEGPAEGAAEVAETGDKRQRSAEVDVVARKDGEEGDDAGKRKKPRVVHEPEQDKPGKKKRQAKTAAKAKIQDVTQTEEVGATPTKKRGPGRPKKTSAKTQQKAGDADEGKMETVKAAN